jgi:hypothetical protein
MRFLLVPYEIPERYELSQALRWVQRRDYLAEGYFGWIIDEAVYGEHMTEYEHGLWHTARERLAAHLITGQLVARGRFIENGSSPHECLHEPKCLDECFPLEHYPEADIPRSAWSSSRIGWGASRLRTPKGEWVDITLSTEALLAAFPEIGVAVDQTVTRRGKFFYIDQDQSDRVMPAKRRGRRAIYDWDLFHAELAKRVLARDGLPARQAELEEQMKEWCLDQWGKEPADSAIREKIARYYETMGDADSSRSKKAV